MATTKAFEIGDFGVNLVVTSTGEVQSLDITTNEVAEHVNFRYFTESRARASISVTGNLTYDNETGILGFTMPTTIASLSNHDTDDLAEGTGNLYFTSARARASLTGGTGITYSSSTGQIELTASGVTAGSYGSASQVPQITVDAYGRITSLSTTSVAGVTDFDYNTSTGVLDIDTADGGNFATTITLAPFDTGDLAEGSRLYYTDARARAAVSATGSLSYNSSTGVFSYTQGNTDTVAEGSTNLYFTNARANAAITKATIDALNVDADTLDGLNSTQFLRSDTSDTMTGNLRISTGTNKNIDIIPLSHQTVPDMGVGITFSRTTSDAPVMAVGVVESTRLGLMSREGIKFLVGATNNYQYTSEAMYIDNSGNVGIGTSSPVGKLHVNTGSGASDANTITLERPSSSAYSGVSFRTGSTTDWSIGHNSVGGFSVYENGAAATTRLTIKDGGNVGIGETSPQFKLHVNGNIYTADTVYSTGHTTGSSSGTLIVYGGGTYQGGRIDFKGGGAAADPGQLIFRAGTGAGDQPEVMRVAPGLVTVTGNVSHQGLTPTSGFDIDQIWTVTKSLLVTTDWIDTGIDSSDITAAGSYMVQMYVDNYDKGGQEYQEFYTGVMSWRGSTNSTATDEIILHSAGHAPNNGRTYLRTRRSYNVDGAKMYLQIKGALPLTAADNYVFKFRRMM
jgi:hypothetical protein